jgi:hypothetical protein
MMVRRVDFDAANWIADTFNLGLAERGLLVTAWALIIRAGGPISRDDLRRGCPGDARPFNNALERLTAINMIVVTDGLLDVERCEIEVELARKRILTRAQNGQKGGRPANKNNSLENRPVSHTRATLPGETKKPVLDSDESKRWPGRSAPSEMPPPDRVKPADVHPHTEEEKAEVAELVERASEALQGKPRSVIRDAAARDAAVKENKFRNRVNTVDVWVATNLNDRTELLAAWWKVVADFQQAGSRAKMPVASRKEFNRFDKMYEAATAQRHLTLSISSGKAGVVRAGTTGQPTEPLADAPAPLSNGGRRTARAAAHGGGRG